MRMIGTLRSVVFQFTEVAFDPAKISVIRSNLLGQQFLIILAPAVYGTQNDKAKQQKMHDKLISLGVGYI